jgi:hypothetical protein
LADGTNALAGAGGVSGDTGGNYDTAIDIGNNDVQSIGKADGAFAGNGDLHVGAGTGSYDTAIDIGNNTNDAVDDASYTTHDAGAYAELGNNNYVSVLGPENSTAVAENGSSNIAYIVDPFGSTASEATSGDGFSSELAAVLFTDGSALANTADYAYDILTALGPETGTF